MRLALWSCAWLLTVCVGATACSRARVESVALMNEGVQLARKKLYEDAQAKLKAAIQVDATNQDAYFNLAQVALEMRDLRGAREALEQAIKAVPGVAAYHEKLGTVALEQADLATAITAFKKAIELDAALPRAHYKLATAYESQGQDQACLESLTAAVRAGPRFMPGYLKLGQRYHALGYSDHALRVYSSALKAAIPATEEEATVHYLRGNVLKDQRQLKQALEAFDAALGLVPTMPDALFSKGWLLADDGQAAEALRVLRSFVKVASGQAPPHYLQAANERIASLSVAL